MIFTDENGDKWETAPNDDTVLIKVNPVKAEPKWSVWQNLHNKGIEITVRVDVSEDQAQLIKAKIEKLMEEHFDE